jgi:hypothetical protein
MITTTDKFYEFTELTIKKCRDKGYNDIAQQLDDAMHLGSSGLEILGAIKAVMVARRTELESVWDKQLLDELVHYVNKAFGME